MILPSNSFFRVLELERHVETRQSAEQQCSQPPSYILWTFTLYHSYTNRPGIYISLKICNHHSDADNLTQFDPQMSLSELPADPPSAAAAVASTLIIIMIDDFAILSGTYAHLHWTQSRNLSVFHLIHDAKQFQAKTTTAAHGKATSLTELEYPEKECSRCREH